MLEGGEKEVQIAKMGKRARYRFKRTNLKFVFRYLKTGPKMSRLRFLKAKNYKGFFYKVVVHVIY